LVSSRINRKVLFTYWLLDEIAIIQPHDARVAAEEFQAWTLKVRDNRTATHHALVRQ